MADHDANAPGLQDQLEDRIRELQKPSISALAN
jgi:hypothetical protein